MNFGRTLFGFRAKDVINEMERIDSQHQAQVDGLQAQIAQAKAELATSEARLADLQRQLDYHLGNEHQIADVMVTAQINAQRIEDQAREKAQDLLRYAEEDLRRKSLELEHLREKVSRFKDDFREVLDNYKYSLDNIKEPTDDAIFSPTLITKERSSAKPKIQDIPS